MSKKPKLEDVPGIGPKMMEKLADAGFKTPLKLSRADPAKLAAKVDGLSEAGAGKIIDAAKELLPDETKAPDAKGKPKTEVKPKKKAEPKVEVKPKKKAEPKAEVKPKKKAEPKAEVKPKKKASKKPAKKISTKTAAKKEPEFITKDTLHDKRLLRIAAAKKKRKPRFRHEQAHRWVRVSDSWRRLRGIDSATREKRKGRIAMVEAGYRSPKAVRGLHPSGYIEMAVNRPADLEGLDPDVHAIKIAGAVGLRKRQVIIEKAEKMMLRVLNPGAPEIIEEEELFSELDDLDDLEVD
ncbi:MAG: 50S ribosomal protein L32e [Candidatus Thorarchaeota archaeon]